MIIAKIKEGIFTGEQLSKDYLLLKYTRDSLQDFIFYWNAGISYNSECLRQYNIVPTMLDKDTRLIENDLEYMHLILQLNTESPYLASAMKLFLFNLTRRFYEDQQILWFNHSYQKRSLAYIAVRNPTDNLTQSLIIELKNQVKYFYEDEIYSLVEKVEL